MMPRVTVEFRIKSNILIFLSGVSLRQVCTGVLRLKKQHSLLDSVPSGFHPQPGGRAEPKITVQLPEQRRAGLQRGFCLQDQVRMPSCIPVPKETSLHSRVHRRQKGHSFWDRVPFGPSSSARRQR